MEYWKNLPTYWMNLQLQDFLAILFLLLMMFVTIICNVLFASFIASKPAGRKTVLGNHIKW